MALLDDDDKFVALAGALAEDFGQKQDDNEEKNGKLDAFIEEFGDVNFYTCATLLVLDPNQNFESLRSNLKMFLLPAFQILVPFGMAWFFIVQEKMWDDNGYCCNHANPIFRFTGFVTFMYSAWQIIDGCDDASAKFFLTKSVEMWSKTGRTSDFKATLMFYAGYASQQICSLFLLIVTYVIYTSQCDTPLDLLMNCVAINFVLDIDTEWMDDHKQEQTKEGATWLYKQWRDACVDKEAEVKKSMKHFSSLRKGAPKVFQYLTQGGDFLIIVLAYTAVFGWTFCPPEY